MAEQLVLIGNDFHAPYHDPWALDLFLQVAQYLKPNGVVINGDGGDLYSVSLHPNHNPERETLLAKEKQKCDNFMVLLSEIASDWKQYLGGNHEYRLDRYVMQKAPALFGAVKFEELFKLKERGWDYLPYSEGASPKQRKYFKVGRLWLAHDLGSANELAHVNAAKTFGANIVIGHGHRIGYQIVGNLQGKPHFGAMTGHMMDIRYADYVPHSIPSCLWQQGFAFAYIDDKGFVDYFPVPVINRRCRVNGKVFKA